MDKHMPPIGLYIHVPFCLKKCPYCDFYSMPPKNGAEQYADAICRAMRHSGLDGRSVSTIYFGGGTPVLLPEKQLRQILDCAAETFCIDKDAEITIEANPAAGAIDFGGFNRVSFGAQSLVDSELKALGRPHTAREAMDSIRQCGAENISADIMLGIPGQTVASLKRSLVGLLALPLSHISAYMLKIEENTPFAAQGVQPADEDALAEMYLFCVEHLAGHGFGQYEISNFARDGKVSRHNLNYWRGGEYLGLGPSAHSFMGGKRFYFPRDLNRFREAENPFALAIQDGPGGGFEEWAMLRLRLTEGLDLSQAASLYDIDAKRILAKAKPMEEHGLLKTKSGAISLTPQGFLVSNSVIAGLLG
jgi:oxygen-independent coproporphyrinogen-3 oxidase